MERIRYLKRQFQKMVKQNQTIRRQITDEFFECVNILWGWS